MRSARILSVLGVAFLLSMAPTAASQRASLEQVQSCSNGYMWFSDTTDLQGPDIVFCYGYPIDDLSDYDSGLGPGQTWDDRISSINGTTPNFDCFKGVTLWKGYGASGTHVTYWGTGVKNLSATYNNKISSITWRSRQTC